MDLRYGAPTSLFRGGRVQFTDRKEVIFKKAVAVLETVNLKL